MSGHHQYPTQEPAVLDCAVVMVDLQLSTLIAPRQIRQGDFWAPFAMLLGPVLLCDGDENLVFSFRSI